MASTVVFQFGTVTDVCTRLVLFLSQAAACRQEFEEGQVNHGQFGEYSLVHPNLPLISLRLRPAKTTTLHFSRFSVHIRVENLTGIKRCLLQLPPLIAFVYRLACLEKSTVGGSGDLFRRSIWQLVRSSSSCRAVYSL